MPAWTEGLSPEENAFLTTKGFDKHEDVKAGVSALINSYRAAEAKLGAPADQMVRWPTGQTPDVVYERLGVPKAADAYKFEGTPEPYKPIEDTVRNIAFANKLTPAQAQAVVAGLSADAEAKRAAEAGAKQLAAQAEEIKLRAAWGGDYDVLHERMMNKLNSLPGWTPAMKEAFTSTAAGKAEILKLAVLDAEPGAKGLGGSSNSQGGGNRTMSPEEAAQALRAKMDDPAWRRKWHAGDAETLAEFNNLTQLQVRR